MANPVSDFSDLEDLLDAALRQADKRSREKAKAPTQSSIHRIPITPQRWVDRSHVLLIYHHTCSGCGASHHILEGRFLEKEDLISHCTRLVRATTLPPGAVWKERIVEVPSFECVGCIPLEKEAAA